MKILYFTDTHIRGTTPKNRKDNFLDTLENKFNELVKVIEDNDIDYVLHGGDLFDRPDISPSIVRKFAMILNKIKIPIYSIAGNHDIYGHNPNTINRTMLGLFDGIGILNLINENDSIVIEKNNLKVQITGSPYKYGIDSSDDKSMYLLDKRNESVDFAIHLTHGMLLDKPFIKGVPHTLIDDIIHTKADITLCAHYHSGFGIKEYDNKYFINPGSLVRITNSLKEIDRMPRAVIIDLNNKTINLDFYYLETAQKGEDVLDRSIVEKNIFRSEKIVQFKQSIDSSQDFDKLNINHILDNLMNTENIDENIKKEAIKRIEYAQIELSGEDD
ncbi:metallophosphoesterase family protein [Senegalia massiliensis]|uniref:Metallophosphoesterase n=1 Tax=Senegalia massiliensis TaxID=1720316 RepID=A0A845R0F8_9CLOT|nr:metallophosphoesterase [Senegalia massiliensis]NBI07920.1 metallophosphoesterase [Senegalia massiliensis]